MSAFETFCWNWYQRNMLPLVIETGLLGRLVDKLGLDALRERFFLRALNEIRQFALKLYAEDAKR